MILPILLRNIYKGERFYLEWSYFFGEITLLRWLQSFYIWIEEESLWPVDSTKNVYVIVAMAKENKCLNLKYLMS